jgi:MYXO-CTERM domain-containing protein
MSIAALAAALALAATGEDTGVRCSEYLGGEMTAGTWSGTGCVISTEPGDVCEQLTGSATDCPDWAEAERRLLADGTLGNPSLASGWYLTCDDGGHEVDFDQATESDSYAWFDPTGKLVGFESDCVGACAKGCCDGHLSTVYEYGARRECNETSRVRFPAAQGDTGSPSAARGCSCASSDAGAFGVLPAMLVAVAVAARRKVGSLA